MSDQDERIESPDRAYHRLSSQPESASPEPYGMFYVVRIPDSEKRIASRARGLFAVGEKPAFGCQCRCVYGIRATRRTRRSSGEDGPARFGR